MLVYATHSMLMLLEVYLCLHACTLPMYALSIDLSSSLLAVMYFS